MKSSTSKLALVTLVVLILFLLSPPRTAAAITCSEAVRRITPCVSYLRSGAGRPPPQCCAGVRNLASATSASVDRRTACNCLKSASRNMRIIPSVASALPRNCGVSLGFTIDPNMNCASLT